MDEMRVGVPEQLQEVLGELHRGFRVAQMLIERENVVAHQCSVAAPGVLEQQQLSQSGVCLQILRPRACVDGVWCSAVASCEVRDGCEIVERWMSGDGCGRDGRGIK